MRAFILRPFGVKEAIDFDAVEAQLIAPALKALGISGRTTLEILRAGDIREDMFQRLLTADLVVADVSIHNANVFYELGIRHSLRDKRTMMIRCSAHQYPFDLQTYRYFTYDQKNPAAALDSLVVALRNTIDSDKKDSPVFNLLPALQAQDPARFVAVSMDFAIEVERAISKKHLGDLELLAEESKGFEWEMSGLRLVGNAQFNLRANEPARKTWESIRQHDLVDLEANLLLATIYQRLGEPARSNECLQLVLKRKDLTNERRAEARALMGSNAKELWKFDWSSATRDQLQESALRSPFLSESYEAYERAFYRDLNHFYSGLNALAMLTMQVELASALPAVWAEHFDKADEAERELQQKKEKQAKLANAVELSLAAARIAGEVDQKPDLWQRISEADLLCLTSRQPARVKYAYKNAIAGATDFSSDSVARQLRLYLQLGLLKANAEAGLSALNVSKEPELKQPERKRDTVLLFAGHRIDSPGRAEPRFPADKESIAKDAIQQVILAEQKSGNHIRCGIAGGASGGDILFHEICQQLGIPTTLFLALPKQEFISESVSSAGPAWVQRFNTLYETLPTRILAESKNLPRWLSEKPDYDFWERNNMWMLHNALAEENSNVTFIALWDGEKGDGPGGTGHLAKTAEKKGAKVIILNTKKLFSL